MRQDAAIEDAKVSRLRRSVAPAPMRQPRFEPTPEPLVIAKGEVKRGRVA